jgi:hypothetical protein
VAEGCGACLQKTGGEWGGVAGLVFDSYKCCDHLSPSQLHSVGVKFLKEIDLGSDAVREGIEKFMPYSFETVNKLAQTYFQVRW